MAHVTALESKADGTIECVNCWGEGGYQEDARNYGERGTFHACGVCSGKGQVEACFFCGGPLHKGGNVHFARPVYKGTALVYHAPFCACCIDANEHNERGI